MSELKKTVLYDLHEELGARMSPFGGWLMPLQYSGIMQEHVNCRSGAALFDTDHMGEFILRGEYALADLELLVSCDVDSMEQGLCRYGLLCNPEGGVIDDLLVYRLSTCEFMLVVNAGTQSRDFEWLQQNISDSTQLEDISSRRAKIDLQGPQAPGIIRKLLEEPIEDLRFYHFMRNRYQGCEVLISRTGYTGEIGFEIYLKPELAEIFWRDCMQDGALPAGLGARDTLRLEMGMPLYGHELSESRNAGESGFERAISANKEFIGSAVVTDQKQRESKLCGIRIDGRRTARHGDTIQELGGERVGTITSGSFAPSLGYAVALGYVAADYAVPGQGLKLISSRCELSGEVVATPFYKDATGRRKLADFL